MAALLTQQTKAFNAPSMYVYGHFDLKQVSGNYENISIHVRSEIFKGLLGTSRS